MNRRDFQSLSAPVTLAGPLRLRQAVPALPPGPQPGRSPQAAPKPRAKTRRTQAALA